ncbi:MAG TPA: enoyl-CoA hydratase-related protein [Baekduia sp.]|nr:enoyl-CoA hydratase-related protein [Baekduia sp.]
MITLRRGAIAQIELDNQPLNLVTGEMMERLDAVLDELARDSEVRAVVVTGAGTRAFCAGSDVKEFEGLAGRVARGKLLYEKYVYRKLAELPVPTIAAIEGDALGGGLELALCCDLRIASARARLGMPEVRLGVIPGSGGTQRLPAVVGPALAKELILVGELISAQRAEHIGLVNAVVGEGEALAAATDMAQRIAQRGPVAVREAKRLIEHARDLDLDAGMAAELDASDRVFASDDMLEGARAFFAKRPPQFPGA